MSTVVEGKDTVKFVNEEQIEQAAADAATVTEETSKSAVVEDEEPASAFNPETGEINWDCPCKFFFFWMIYILKIRGETPTYLLEFRFRRYGTGSLWRTIQGCFQLFCLF